MGFITFVFDKYSKDLFCIVASLLSISSGLLAQTIPLTDPFLLEKVRQEQLRGGVDSILSFNVHPLGFHYADSLDFFHDLKPVNLGTRKLDLKILPVRFGNQFQGNPFYYQNDGLMIPASGYQTYSSAGIYASLGILSIQLNPEIIYASNPEDLSSSDEIALAHYQTYINGIADLPPYYGSANEVRTGWGQSSVRLNFGPASLGVSTENLWWGPGRRNALIMTNAAPGFAHLTLNTIRPVKTPVGSFEGQIIGGKLLGSGEIQSAYKNQDWRYLSGMIFSYQPRWVPGLSLGLTRVFQMYHQDLKIAGDYFPLIQPFQKTNPREYSINRDQISSIFARMLLPGSKAEIYGEFARNDHAMEIRDLFTKPNDSRAYLAGFQKLVDLPADEQLLLAAEVTQLSQSPSQYVRDAGPFYVHKIDQGYTHRGEVVGAALGPGGNMQTLEFAWLKGFKKLGLQLERFVHNNDFYQTLNRGSDEINGQWVDVSASVLVNWQFENLLINSRVMGIQSYNYLWQSGHYGTGAAKYVFNIHANVGLSYYFNSNGKKR